MAKFAAKDSNKNITLSPHGTGKVVVGTGAADATVQSDGNHNLVLQTGNSTTGSISITDGADGDIAISPNGTGTVVVNTDLDVDNININGNAITSTNTDGNIDLTPNGTGEVNISKVDIDGGTVDGITLGTNSAVTEAQIDNINVNGNAITSTNTDGDIDLTPNGTGEVNISKVDIDSGAIDGVTIGTNSAVTDLRVDNLKLDGNQITSTNTNGDIEITPNGSGKLGVGTASPDSNIEVSTSSGRSSVKITSVDATGCDVLLERGTAATGSRGIHNESGSLKFSYSTNNFSSRTDQVEISETGSITTPNGEFNGTLGSSAVYPAGGTGNPISVAYLYDEKSNGTVGGDFSSGFQTRTLNTESDPDGIVSLSSNQFTLGAGTYLLMFSASGYDVLQHRTAIYDVTGTAYISPPGSSELTQTAYNDMTRSMGSCIVTPSSDNVYELRHYANTTKGTSGFGFATSSGLVEIYATVTIFKLK